MLSLKDMIFNGEVKIGPLLIAVCVMSASIRSDIHRYTSSN